MTCRRLCLLLLCVAVMIAGLAWPAPRVAADESDESNANLGQINAVAVGFDPDVLHYVVPLPDAGVLPPDVPIPIEAEPEEHGAQIRAGFLAESTFTSWFGAGHFEAFYTFPLVGSRTLTLQVRSEDRTTIKTYTFQFWRPDLQPAGPHPFPPTGLRLAPDPQPDPQRDTLVATWTAPDDSLTARVTGYEVRYKTVDAPDAAASVAGDPTTGWVTTRVGTTPRAILDAPWAFGREYHATVRALSAVGASLWSTQAQGAPRVPRGGPAATPLTLLSASRTSVTEGGTVTITARLASAAASAVTIPLGVEGTAGAGDYSLSSPGIAIGAGQRSGSVTLTITDDTEVEGAEILYITPDIGQVRNAAAPDSNAVVYQVASLRITIAASDQPTTTTTSSESDSPPPYHSDPDLAELQKRIVRCAESIKTTVDQYVAGTATAEQVRAARAASAACQS